MRHLAGDSGRPSVSLLLICRTIPINGGRPTTVAWSDVPARQFHRHGIAQSQGRLYFPLIERNSDVWVAEITSAQ